MAERWLVTGGAGYIGSHTVRGLLDAGFDVDVLDDLSTGIAERLPSSVPVHTIDILDTEAVRDLLAHITPAGVIHLAGKKQARESLEIPMEYWTANLMGTVSLLSAMVEVGTSALLFSSSCSVYGSQSDVSENSMIAPESPYAASKAAAEMAINDVARIESLTAVSLRYFNVIGCGDFPSAHDVATDSVVPRMVNAAMRGDALPVYGTDRATPDGSCLRDYLDVRDIADAHVRIVQAISAGRDVAPVLNASSGIPVSVLQMAAAVQAAIGGGTEIDHLPSHPADPSEIWAAQSPLLRELGWSSRYTLAESVASHVASLDA